MTEQWHKLPRRVLESPSLGILKWILDTVLDSWLSVALLEQWVGVDGLLSNLNQSLILWMQNTWPKMKTGSKYNFFSLIAWLWAVSKLYISWLISLFRQEIHLLFILSINSAELFMSFLPWATSGFSYLKPVCFFPHCNSAWLIHFWLQSRPQDCMSSKNPLDAVITA